MKAKHQDENAGDHGGAATPNGVWRVWKFGGSSLADADCLMNAARLVRTELMTMRKAAPYERLAVVASAQYGITNLLEAACSEAVGSTGDERLNVSLTQAVERHRQVLDVLQQRNAITEIAAAAYTTTLDSEYYHLRQMLVGIRVCGTCPPAFQHAVVGFGELWSSRLLFALLLHEQSDEFQTGFTLGQRHTTTDRSRTEQDNAAALHKLCNATTQQCCFCAAAAVQEKPEQCDSAMIRWLDARRLIIIRDPSSTYTASRVQDSATHIIMAHDLSAQRAHTWLELHPNCRLVVMPGFLCSTESGVVTTLQRNGSDFSGAILAQLFRAHSYTIWKDVDGVYAAHPRYVQNPYRLSAMSYAEASELALFGACVLHHRTMEPCVNAKIPILLRSYMDCSAPGTWDTRHCSRGTIISDSASQNGQSLQCAKAFTFIDDVALIYVHGTPLLPAASIAARTYAAVADQDAPLFIGCQASSDATVALVLPHAFASATIRRLETTFHKEIQYDATMRLGVVYDLALVVAVGECLGDSVSSVMQLTNALASSHIHVQALLQGCSPRSCFFLIDQKYLTSALQVLHDAVYPAKSQKLPRSVSFPKRIALTSPSILRLVCLAPESLPFEANSSTTLLFRCFSALLVLAQHMQLLHPSPPTDTPLVFSGVTNGQQFISSETTIEPVTQLLEKAVDASWALLDFRPWLSAHLPTGTTAGQLDRQESLTTTPSSPTQKTDTSSSSEPTELANDSSLFPQMWCKMTQRPMFHLKYAFIPEKSDAVSTLLQAL